MNKRRLRLTYILIDVLAAALAWICIYIFRKIVGEGADAAAIRTAMAQDYKFALGLIACPIYWVVLHALSDYYSKIYKKSRLDELITTISITFIGTLIFFFAFILDDIIHTPHDYIKYFFCLFISQFLLTYIPRLCITTNINRKIHNGIITFPAIITGSDDIALQTFERVMKQKPRSGSNIIGYVKIDEESEDKLAGKIPCLGTLASLSEIITANPIDEIIIALHNGQRKHISHIITVAHTQHQITMTLLPGTQDLLMGSVRTAHVLSEPFMTISPKYLTVWQSVIKRGFDIVMSLIAMILLLPLYIVLAIAVKCSSPGPIFYKQERIGLHGKPFNIIKFRSMYVDAEKSGPMLSSKEDNRITKIGRFMRQYRLDETPQFFNVLRNDMSLVGPRPERQYYIEKITERAPYYTLLLDIKPGITSWGEVKYGYAENVDEMIERLRWDLLYIENMSLQMDVKILIYTVLIILKKEGK
ncbi:MAG: sugar transferase [Bacteroidales bacterium]|nr:sugar transferase [Bacteroidales bacterium]